MEVRATPLEGVLLIEPRVFPDARGFFLETWQQKRYEEAGLTLPFVQDNHSCSARGVLRGIHFQIAHPQGKLISVSQGRVYDVAVDLRPGSPTFGQWYGAELSADNHRQLWIPPGLGHAFCVLSVKRSNDNPGLLKRLSRSKVLLLMCTPAILFFFLFSYMPLPGIWVAFVKYNYRDGIFGSKFVGLNNFEFLISSGKLVELTITTILYNLCFIILGNLLAVLVAILLNEIRSKMFKKVSQSLMFLPYFVSQVLIGILVFNMLNYDTGFVNNILGSLGLELWEPYSDPNVWPPILVLVYLWQNTGYNSVVYFAAIMGIDAGIIEAAKVDGANCFRKIWHIILPALKPTIVILLLFALGGIVKGNFGLFYNIIGTNSLLFPTTDIIETYVYRCVTAEFNFSTASAVGLYQSLIGFVIVVTVNFIVKKIEPDYSLF